MNDAARDALPFDDDAPRDPCAERLMSRATLRLAAHGEPVDLRRGMDLRSRGGEPLGWLAAIVEDAERRATHLLLCPPPPVLPGYRRVPVRLVVAVGAAAVTLDLSAGDLPRLPVHPPPGRPRSAR